MLLGLRQGRAVKGIAEGADVMMVPERSRFEKVTQPSLSIRLAVAIVLLVALLILLGLLYSDPGCTGEGVPLR